MGGGNPIKKIIDIPKKIIKGIVDIGRSIIKGITNIASGFLGFFGMSFDTPSFSGGENFEASLQGITVNKQSNVARIPVVYGERKIGGVRVFVGSGSSDNKYLYVCLAVCEGEIDSFQGIYVNDERQNLSSFATGGVRTVSKTNFDGNTSSFYVNGSSRASFEFFTGTEDQGASSLLKEHNLWTDDHRLQGVAYVACRFEWVKAEFDGDGNQTVFNPWGGIPTIQVIVRGKKVLTSYASKDTSNNTSSYESEIGSFTYSNNPADCLLDYLRNPRYGKGLNDNRVNFAEFNTARGVCNQTPNFGQSLGTANFLLINDVIDTNQTMFENTKIIMQSCRGFLPYVNGKYELKIETAESSPGDLQNINDEHIIGAIGVTSDDKNARYNQCKLTFANEEKDYESDTVYYTNNTFLSEDNSEPLILDLGAPGITRRERALDFAEYLVKRSRKQVTVQIKVSSEGQNIVAGELITLTHQFKQLSDMSGPTAENYLFNEKMFRVIAQKLNYDGTVDLTLLEHQNDIYSVTQQQEDTDLSPIIAAKADKIFTPTDSFVRSNQLTVATGSDSKGAFIEFLVSEGDALNTSIRFIMDINGGDEFIYERAARAPVEGIADLPSKRPQIYRSLLDTFYSFNGQAITVGDNINYKIYAVKGVNSTLIFKNSAVVTGTTTQTVSVTDATSGGFA